ncbi:hypothetical protein K3495_g3804 [Podosphaera aphanis]|nr:hypothetical protein K3495_g3804 [Podosphaera aphanis]
MTYLCQSSLSAQFTITREKTEANLTLREILRNLHKVTTLREAIKIPKNREVCEACQLTKTTNRKSKTLADRKERRLSLIQFDIAGPFPKSLRGNRYFLLIIDSFSRKNWILLLKQKSDAIQCLHTFKTTVEKEVNERIKAARSDNAPELLLTVEGWREQDGIEAQPTVIASSHQNGAAERNIRTAEADMRLMLKESNLLIEFWDEAVETDPYMRNRTATGPIISDCVTSPQEAWTNKRPTVDHTKIWGSKSYSYVNLLTIPPGMRKDKLVDRDSKENNLAETINYASGHRQPELTEQLAEIENSEPTQPQGKTLPDPVEQSKPTEQQEVIASSISNLKQQIAPVCAKRRLASEDISEEEHFAKRIKAYIVQLQTLDDIDILIDHAFAAQVICGVQIPLTYHQAIQDTKWGKFWRQAIDAELIALLQNNTWKEVVRPQGVNLVSTKWVFTVKPKLDGSIDRFKARLIARGFSQKAGEDYHETFAPTVRIDTLRLILAMAASENLEFSQFDIKNAFTGSTLKEEIYATAPLGVEVRPGNVLQLLRSLYGLKQAARDWNLLMKTELLR